MFKTFLISVVKTTATAIAINSKPLVQNVVKGPNIIPFNTRSLSSILSQYEPSKSLLSNTNVANHIVSRDLTKVSLGKGKRKSVKAVLKRFYRLSWGGWIRTKCGRQKKLWKKSPPRKRRLRQHVLCNATQSYMLDKMVGPYWRKPKYYVDDPYEPYHSREEYQYTYTKPRPYFPPEQQ